MGMYFSFHGLGMPRYYGSMKEKEKANKMCFTSYQPAAPLTGTNGYNNQERRSCYLRPYLSIAFMILPRSPHCSVQLLEPSTAGLTGAFFYSAHHLHSLTNSRHIPLYPYPMTCSFHCIRQMFHHSPHLSCTQIHGTSAPLESELQSIPLLV